MTDAPRSPVESPLPPGAQYEVTLPPGRAAIVAFPPGDPDQRTIAQARRNDTNSEKDAVLWFQHTTALTPLSHDGAMMIGQEVSALLPWHFTVFFDDLKHIAPEPGDVLPACVPSRHDRTLH